jgi:Alcohol dehydrogenase transcription factor Myb/SANT-like.
LISEIERRPFLYDCSLEEYSDKGLKERLWAEVYEAFVSEWSQLDGPEKREKDKPCFSSILIQMHRFTLVCCKIQRRLTLQMKLTPGESYSFLVVVNIGKYFFQNVSDSKSYLIVLPRRSSVW